MEEMLPNPLLERENFFKKYQENIDELKNHPEMLSFQKMCYELFEAYELGRKFMEYVTDNILLKPNADIEKQNYVNKNIWGEGYKAFPLMIRSFIIAHKQQIKAGADDARRNAAKS
jgi:hypothetical protein